MIIRDDRTTNSPPGIAMSMSPEYPLDGGKIQHHHQLWRHDQYPFDRGFPVNWEGELFSKLLIFYALFFQQNCFHLIDQRLSQEILYRHGGPDGHDNGFPVLVDHLHLRDGHLPLPLLRILLDRCAQEDAGWYRGGKQTGATFPRFSIGSRFFKDQKKWSTLLCFGKQTGVTFPRFSIGSSFEDL